MMALENRIRAKYMNYAKIRMYLMIVTEIQQVLHCIAQILNNLTAFVDLMTAQIVTPQW